MTHDLIDELTELLNDPEADVSDVKWLVDAHRSRTRGFPGLPPEWEGRQQPDKSGANDQPPKPVTAEQVAQIVRAALQERQSVTPPLRVDFKEVCRRVGKSERTVRRWIARHIIPYERIGGGALMFDLAAVDAALKRYRRNAVGD